MLMFLTSVHILEESIWKETRWRCCTSRSNSSTTTEHGNDCRSRIGWRRRSYVAFHTDCCTFTASCSLTCIGTRVSSYFSMNSDVYSHFQSTNMVHIYLTAPRSASSTSWLHPLHQLLASSSAACVNVLIFPLCVHILMHNSPINFFFTNVRCSIRHGGKICHVSALFWFRAFSCSKEAEGGVVIWMFHLQLISQI